MQVQELMARNPVSVEAQEPVIAAARLMQQRNIGSVPVCDGEGALVGMLTDRDVVLRCVVPGRDPGQLRVAEVMTTGAVTVTPESDVNEALRRMRTEQVRRLPVVREGALVGMLSLADVARTQKLDMEAAQALSGITANVCRK